MMLALALSIFVAPLAAAAKQPAHVGIEMQRALP